MALMTEPERKTVDRRNTRKKPPRKTVAGGQPNRARLAEARAITSSRRSAPRLDADPVEVIQEGLDGLVGDLRFTQKMVDNLTEKEMWRDTMMLGRIPNEWIRLRDEYRDRTMSFAGRMVERGIAERAVNIRAAQAALMATTVKEALRRAGADPKMVARVGDELRAIAQEASSVQLQEGS